MTQQKTPTSSKNKKPPRKRVVTLSDGTVVHTDNNHAPNIKKGRSVKHDIPKEPFSTELGKGYEDWEVKDDFDKLEFPPPSNHPVFRKFWAESIDNITNRDNFKPVHLGLFEALCRLRVELRNLDDFIMRHGHVYRVITVLGDQRRTYPEVLERMKVLTQVANYSKLLDLVPQKDKTKRGASKAEEDEWA